MARKIISILLLVFVTVSVAKLVFKGRVADPAEEIHKVTETTPKGNQTLVYYFHGNVRCKTCNKIEANTRKAIESGFSERIKTGEVAILTVNMEEPANAHFVENYKLTNSSVVLSRMEDGKEVKWSRLDEAWDLVGDDQQFIAYIQSEAQSMLEGVTE